MKKFVLAIGLFGLSINMAVAGPFGLEMGMPLESIGRDSLPIPDGYRISDVPDPHPAFAYYEVVGNKTVGLCRIVASTPEYVLDESGVSKVTTTFAELKQWLDKQYGEGIKTIDMVERSDGKPKNVAVMKIYNWQPEQGRIFEGNVAQVVLSTSPIGAGSGKAQVLVGIQLNCANFD